MYYKRSQILHCVIVLRALMLLTQCFWQPWRCPYGLHRSSRWWSLL